MAVTVTANVQILPPCLSFRHTLCGAAQAWNKLFEKSAGRLTHREAGVSKDVILALATFFDTKIVAQERRGV